MGRPKKEAVKTTESTATLDIIKHLQKKSNSHVSMLSEEGNYVLKPKFLSTQLYTVDRMLGGGVPAGRLTELYSRTEGCGKSTLAAHLMAEMQRQGGTVVLMDTERGFTTQRLRDLGVDPDNVIFVEPNYIEEACETISEVLQYLDENPGGAGKVLVIWDSVTATSSKAEYEANYGDLQMASAARAWSSSLRKLKDELAHHDCYVVLLNQTRENIGAMWGDKRITTGGHGIKFYSSCRLKMDVKANAKIKEGTTLLGKKITMWTEKNRLASPYQETTASLYYKHGFDIMRSFLDLLIELKVVERKGAWYAIEGFNKSDGTPRSFQTKEFKEVLEEIKKDEDLVDRLVTELKKANITLAAIQRYFPDAT